MVQILYSFVAGTNSILIEANSGSSKSKYIRASKKILKKISRGELRRPNGMATLLSGNYAYNYIHGCEPDEHNVTLEPLVFLCVTESLPYAATPSEMRETAFIFLINIRRAFLEQFRGDLDVLIKYPSTSGNDNDNTSIISGSNNDIVNNNLINIDNEIRADLRRFTSFMKDQMLALAQSDHEDDNNEEKINLKDNYDNILENSHNNNSYDYEDKDEKENSNNKNDVKTIQPIPNSTINPLKYQQRENTFDRIKTQLHEAKKTVAETIDLAIEREEKISLLERKAEELNHESNAFRSRSRNLRTAFCRDLYKQRCMIAFIIIFVLYFLSAMICGWSWDSCTN